MSEIACEAADTCDTDQPSFKAYLSRWLAIASQLAPAYHDTIMVKLQASATAAATACTGGTVATNGGNTIDGTTCGRKWSSGSYDGSYGVGESMSALAIFGMCFPSLRPRITIDAISTTPRGSPKLRKFDFNTNF